MFGHVEQGLTMFNDHVVDPGEVPGGVEGRPRWVAGRPRWVTGRPRWVAGKLRWVAGRPR